MTTGTFEELARGLAEAGAARACIAEADALTRCAEAAGGGDTAGFATGARGLRIAARILEQLAPAVVRRPSFRPVGLRGAVLAGHVALAEGRPGQAEQIGRALAAAAPDVPAGLRLLGQALFAQGRFEQAEEAQRVAVEVDPADGVSRALLAEARWFLGRRDEAEELFAREVAVGGEGGRLAEALWLAARAEVVEEGAVAEERP
jgi:Flp pilus assembly protein TadD